MSKVPRISLKPVPSTTLSAELNALTIVYRRAIARYEEVRAAGQDKAKTKQKSLHTEEGGSHDLEERFFVRQKV